MAPLSAFCLGPRILPVLGWEGLLHPFTPPTYWITCGSCCPGKFFVVSKFVFVCMCSCSIVRVNLLERGLEVLAKQCFLIFSASCTFLGILFGQLLCSLHIQWQQFQNSCSPVSCVDVCYVFSCNAVWGLLPQTIDGSKCNGHMTNEEHVMLPSWSVPLLAFVSQASFPGSVMQINQLMTDKMAFLHRHACNKKGNAVSHVPIQRAL